MNIQFFDRNVLGGTDLNLKTSAKDDNPKTYRASGEETLSTIAARFGVHWEQLMEWNGLADQFAGACGFAVLPKGYVLFVSNPDGIGGDFQDNQTFGEDVFDDASPYTSPKDGAIANADAIGDNEVTRLVSDANADAHAWVMKAAKAEAYRKNHQHHIGTPPPVVKPEDTEVYKEYVAQAARVKELSMAYDILALAGSPASESTLAREWAEVYGGTPPMTVGAAQGMISVYGLADAREAQRTEKEDVFGDVGGVFGETAEGIGEDIGSVAGIVYYRVLDPTNPTSVMNIMTAGMMNVKAPGARVLPIVHNGFVLNAANGPMPTQLMYRHTLPSGRHIEARVRQVENGTELYRVEYILTNANGSNPRPISETVVRSIVKESNITPQNTIVMTPNGTGGWQYNNPNQSRNNNRYSSPNTNVANSGQTPNSPTPGTPTNVSVRGQIYSIIPNQTQSPNGQPIFEVWNNGQMVTTITAPNVESASSQVVTLNARIQGMQNLIQSYRDQGFIGDAAVLESQLHNGDFSALEAPQHLVNASSSYYNFYRNERARLTTDSAGRTFKILSREELEGLKNELISAVDIFCDTYNAPTNRRDLYRNAINDLFHVIEEKILNMPENIYALSPTNIFDEYKAQLGKISRIFFRYEGLARAEDRTALQILQLYLGTYIFNTIGNKVLDMQNNLSTVGMNASDTFQRLFGMISYALKHKDFRYYVRNMNYFSVYRNSLNNQHNQSSLPYTNARSGNYLYIEWEDIASDTNIPYEFSEFYDKKLEQYRNNAPQFENSYEVFGQDTGYHSSFYRTIYGNEKHPVAGWTYEETKSDHNRAKHGIGFEQIINLNFDSLKLESVDNSVRTYYDANGIETTTTSDIYVYSGEIAGVTYDNIIIKFGEWQNGQYFHFNYPRVISIYNKD